MDREKKFTRLMREAEEIEVIAITSEQINGVSDGKMGSKIRGSQRKAGQNRDTIRDDKFILYARNPSQLSWVSEREGVRRR